METHNRFWPDIYRVIFNGWGKFHSRITLPASNKSNEFSASMKIFNRRRNKKKRQTFQSNSELSSRHLTKQKRGNNRNARAIESIKTISTLSFTRHAKVDLHLIDFIITKYKFATYSHLYVSPYELRRTNATSVDCTFFYNGFFVRFSHKHTLKTEMWTYVVCMVNGGICVVTTHSPLTILVNRLCCHDWKVLKTIISNHVRQQKNYV